MMKIKEAVVDPRTEAHLMREIATHCGYRGERTYTCYRWKRRNWHEVLCEFIDMDVPIAELVIDADDIPTHVTGSVSSIIRMHGMPIKCRTKKGKVYLVNMDLV